jgi:hypothetical protein
MATARPLVFQPRKPTVVVAAVEEDGDRATHQAEGRDHLMVLGEDDLLQNQEEAGRGITQCVLQKRKW